MDQTQQTPPDRKTFDQRTADEVMDFFRGLFLRVPEIATLACVVSWKGELNDSNIFHSVWMSEDGPIRKLEHLFGSAHQTLKLYELQLADAAKALQSLQDNVRVVGDQLVKKNAELEKVSGRAADDAQGRPQGGPGQPGG